MEDVAPFLWMIGAVIVLGLLSIALTGTADLSSM